MSVGICAYSFNTGYDVFQLMDLALKNGLTGIEFPPDDCLPNLSPDFLTEIRHRAEKNGLYIIVDGGPVENKMLARLIPITSALGASTLRVVISGVLGGDRRSLSGHWHDHLVECRNILREVLPIAEENKITIAVESHSDATSHDMLWLCEELKSKYIGVTLDVGNVLAVCEEPFGYTERLLPHLCHVHLKDYTLHPTSEGYRIARCPLGSGVVEYPRLLDLINEYPTNFRTITKTIELGAIYARHVRMLMDDYWVEYPDRDIKELLPFLRLYWANVRPREEDWRTPKEKGESVDSLKYYENYQFEKSVTYLKNIGVINTAKNA